MFICLSLTASEVISRGNRCRDGVELPEVVGAVTVVRNDLQLYQGSGAILPNGKHPPSTIWACFPGKETSQEKVWTEQKGWTEWIQGELGLQPVYWIGYPPELKSGMSPPYLVGNPEEACHRTKFYVLV
jgi:hypothetical protein